MTSKLIPQGGFSDKYAADDFALAFARIENTFFVNGGWFESETWHFDNIDKIRGKFPIVIVQVSPWLAILPLARFSRRNAAPWAGRCSARARVPVPAAAPAPAAVSCAALAAR